MNQYGFDEYDKSIYDARDSGAPDAMPSGGLVSAGSFGSSLDSYRGDTPVMRYVNRINPNLAIGGLMAVGGMIVLSSLVTGLGQANPNNQMLQAQQVQAEANQEVVKAQADALKTVANQRPACIALVCVSPDSPEPTPPQDFREPSEPNYPEYYQQPDWNHPVTPSPNPSPSPTATTIPTDAKTVEFWRYWQTDAAYINEWQHYCASYGWTIQPECQALYQALFNY